MVPPNRSFPRGLTCGKGPLKYKLKQNKNGKTLPNIRLAHSILKCKFPSIDKPLRIWAPQKEPLKKEAPGPEFYSSLSHVNHFTKHLLNFFCLVSFQFVVCDSGDYTVHAMDPDVLVEWDLIEQVVCICNALQIGSTRTWTVHCTFKN